MKRQLNKCLFLFIKTTVILFLAIIAGVLLSSSASVQNNHKHISLQMWSETHHKNQSVLNVPFDQEKIAIIYPYSLHWTQ